VANQNARRRYTTNPRYGHQGGLPSVFPYKRTLSLEDAGRIGDFLSREIEQGSPYWFAISGHSKSVDGHVTLWLSVEAALFLERIDLISYVDETGSTTK
jgi:hypothetical protein